MNTQPFQTEVGYFRSPLRHRQGPIREAKVFVLKFGFEHKNLCIVKVIIDADNIASPGLLPEIERPEIFTLVEVDEKLHLC